MLIPEGALPLDWWDRMDRVLLRKRRQLKDDENLCTDDDPPSPYAVDGLHVYQFCEQCRTD